MTAPTSADRVAALMSMPLEELMALLATPPVAAAPVRLVLETAPAA